MTQSRWFLPTNTENLALYFSHGMMTCPQGLGSQYVTDVMESYPAGYLPFFSSSNLSEAIKRSTKEDENLERCLIELDLTQFDICTVYAVTDNPGAHEDQVVSKITQSPADIAFVGTSVFLMPAPLPLQCIKQIIVESSELKSNTAKYFNSNFGTDSKLFKVEKKLFDTNERTGDILHKEFQIDDQIPQNKINYDHVGSLGGALSMVFYQTKNGREIIKSFDSVSTFSFEGNQKNLLSLFSYLFEGEAPDFKSAEIFNDVFEILSNRQMDIGQKRFAIIDLLKNKDYSFGQPGFARGVSESLQKINDRREEYTSPEEVISRILESRNQEQLRPETNFLVALVLYFFRDNTETALKFYHEKFSPIDYLFHSVFFGVSFGFLGIPGQLRKYYGLLNYVSNQQTQYVHCMVNSGEMVFKSVARPKVILADLVKSSSNGNFDKFYIWLADHLQINAKAFMSWDLQHKGYVCQGNSPLHFSTKPSLKTIIDFDCFGRELLISTTGNDKDLLNYNHIIDQFSKLTK